MYLIFMKKTQNNLAINENNQMQISVYLHCEVDFMLQIAQVLNTTNSLTAL